MMRIRLANGKDPESTQLSSRYSFYATPEVEEDENEDGGEDWKAPGGRVQYHDYYRVCAKTDVGSREIGG